MNETICHVAQLSTVLTSKAMQARAAVNVRISANPMIEGIGGSVSAVCQKDGFAQHDQADKDNVGQKQLKGYPEVLSWRFCKAHEVRQYDHSEENQHRSADAA